jgi:hypothetical protein
MSDEDGDDLDKALGITPYDTFADKISEIVAIAKNDSASEDFTFARANIREIVQNGADAITKLALIAEQSQNPRAFEVLAKLMDTVVNANEKLLEAQKKIRELDKADISRDQSGKSVTNNNLFVGSTAELQRALKELKDNE